VAQHYIDEGRRSCRVAPRHSDVGLPISQVRWPLIANGYRIIVPDMIGFGLDGHIADLTALLRARNLSRITLVCHDWGGPTGLGFALSSVSGCARRC
jgi:pimeloyl-ACP methyl ester carboxylesterase